MERSRRNKLPKWLCHRGGKKQKKQMRTFEINDGLETILFHTLLPPPDEEGRRMGEEREGEGRRWGAGGMGGSWRWWGGRDVQCQAGKTFSISLTISCVITDVV